MYTTLDRLTRIINMNICKSKCIKGGFTETYGKKRFADAKDHK